MLLTWKYLYFTQKKLLQKSELKGYEFYKFFIVHISLMGWGCFQLIYATFLIRFNKDRVLGFDVTYEIKKFYSVWDEWYWMMNREAIVEITVSNSSKKYTSELYERWENVLSKSRQSLLRTDCLTLYWNEKDYRKINIKEKMKKKNKWEWSPLVT